MNAPPDSLEIAISQLRTGRHLPPEREQALAAWIARFGQSAVEPLAEILATAPRDRAVIATRALIALGEAAEPAVERLLNHQSDKVRERAASVLLGIGSPAAVECLRIILVRELAAERQACVALTIRRGLRALLVAAFLLWTWPMGDVDKLASGPGVFVAGLLLVLTGLLVYVDAGRRIRRCASVGLAQQDDVRLAGVLAACLSDNDSGVRDAAAVGLKRLLPRVTQSQASLFDLPGVDGLLGALGGRDRDLTLAILTALGEIGDERALPYVERFAHDRFSGWDPRVYQAANEALPRIQVRVAESQEARTLLRAASGALDEGATLVRPASSVQSPPEQLLRPAEGKPG